MIKLDKSKHKNAKKYSEYNNRITKNNMKIYFTNWFL